MVCPSVLGVERAKAYQVARVRWQGVINAPHLEALGVAAIGTAPALARQYAAHIPR